MKMKKNIIMALSAMFVMACCTISCQQQEQQERFARVSSEVSKTVPMGKWTNCKICKGTGNCIYCKGKGKTNGKACNMCSGTGHCSNCEGQGGFRSE